MITIAFFVVVSDLRLFFIMIWKIYNDKIVDVDYYF